MKIFTRKYTRGTSLFFIKNMNFVVDTRAEFYSEELYYELSTNRDCENLYHGNFQEPLLEALLFMPKDIIRNIQDVRVFMLGVVSQNVYDRMMSFIDGWITEFYHTCEELRKRQKTDREKVSTSCQLLYDIDFADATITKMTKKDGNLILSIKHVINNNQLRVVFYDGIITAMENNIVGDVILYEEIYKNDENMQYHILCEHSEIIISFTDAKIEGDEIEDLNCIIL